MKRVSRLFFLLLAVSILANSAIYSQSVTMGPISQTTFCTGDSIIVNFTATGSFGKNNLFTLQLSDPTGSFQTAFTSIASIKDSIGGSLSISSPIPSVPASSQYRVRVVSIVPYQTSNDNGTDIKICTRPNLAGIEINGGTMYSVNQPMSFRSDQVQDAITTWKLGPDASPDSGGGAIFGAVFSTGGDKFVTITITSQCGCSFTGTYTFHVYDCSKPIIPKDVIIIDKDTTIWEPRFSAYWVNPTAILELTSADHDTVFAEPGATIKSSVHCHSNIYYLKSGASVQGYDDGDNICLYAAGSSGGPSVYGNMLCPDLNFDYSEAPNNPNVSSVANKLQAISISVVPNPTTGVISIQGAPSNDLNVSVLNLLGETVMELKNLQSPDFKLDLSKLVAGTYYIRFSSANSVVTKMVVRE